MSIKSAFIQRKGSLYRGIFCHSNGHPFAVGRILQEHYREEYKVDRLMKLGAISSLGEEIGEKHDFNWRGEYDWNVERTINDPRSRMCNSYIRDKEEKHKSHHAIETRSLDALIHFFAIRKIQFIYVYDNGIWYFREHSLAEILSSSFKNFK